MRKEKMNTGFKGKYLSYVKIAFYFLWFSTSYAFADDSFNSIGGYSLGQQCTGSEFTKEKTEVRNPSDVLDTIQVKRNIVKRELKGGYKLRVECGIIDNKINYISLTSDNSDDISEIKESLKEKMGRPADDSENINSKPMNLLGNRIDGHKMESEEWFLSDSKTATAYTMITVPYGTSSLSDLKWRGGISLSIKDRNISEWNYVKQKGSLSSKEAEAISEEKRKERIRGLLE